jgi:hypothetical protein
MKLDGNRKVRNMLPRFEVACGDQRREEKGKEFRFSRQIFAFQVARSLRDSLIRAIRFFKQ